MNKFHSPSADELVGQPPIFEPLRLGAGRILRCRDGGLVKFSGDGVRSSMCTAVGARANRRIVGTGTKSDWVLVRSHLKNIALRSTPNQNPLSRAAYRGDAFLDFELKRDGADLWEAPFSAKKKSANLRFAGPAGPAGFSRDHFGDRVGRALDRRQLWPCEAVEEFLGVFGHASL